MTSQNIGLNDGRNLKPLSFTLADYAGQHKSKGHEMTL